MNILTQIIIAFLSVIALFIYDRIKKQATGIVKYVVAFAAVFAVPYLLHWKLSYYLEAGAIWLLIVKAWSEIVSIYNSVANWIKNKAHLIIAGIALAIVLTGCGTATPDNKVYASDSTQTGWYATKPVYSHSVLIKPTWSQSFHYASEAGWDSWLVFAIILFIAFCVMLYLAISDGLPKLFDNELIKFGALFVLFAGALACFGSQPGSIKWNNDHWVPKEQYEQNMSTAGNTTAIWDSLANNCHIPWGPDKGCKK